MLTGRQKEMTERDDGGWRMKEKERGRRTRKDNRREASVETFGNKMMKLSLLHKDIDSKSKAMRQRIIIQKRGHL